MKYAKLPAPALAKLLSLEEAVEELTQRVAGTQDGITSARARLTGGFRKQAEGDDLTASLKQLIVDKPILEIKLHAAQSVLSNCKVWLDRLPEGTALEPVEVKANGHDLSSVRTRLEAAQGELAHLHAVPTPSADVRQRVEDYVRSMARPTISGLGKGNRLKVVWPGAGWDTGGPREDRAEVLPMMALLFHDAMVDALLREVERLTSGAVPLAQRAARIAALEREIEQLSYVEEVLIDRAIANGEDVQRSPNALPQAVLGVKVVEATKSSRAA